MSTLVNLVISFIMGFFFGHQLEEPQTTHHDLNIDSIEIYQKLEQQQHILNC